VIGRVPAVSAEMHLSGFGAAHTVTEVMDDETRAYFEEMRRRFDAMDQRFDVTDRRFDASDAKLDAYRREAGVTAEHLLDEIKLVAEVGRSNGQAIERLRDEMNARFRENEIVLRAAFGQIRRDVEERPDRR